MFRYVKSQGYNFLNKKVDLQEMEKIIRAMYELLGEDYNGSLPLERAKDIMQKLDSDEDGYLKYWDFIL